MLMKKASPMQEIEHLAALIGDFRIAMLTTVRRDGTLRSRPMATQRTGFDGGLWFFTQIDSGKVNEVEDEGQVNVTYENSRDAIYVSLSGRATLVLDQQQIQALWHDDLRIWLPQGLNAPHLALLRVDVDKWSYWDGRSNDLSEHHGSLRDEPAEVVPDLGDHRRVDISGIWISQDVGTTKTRNEMPLDVSDEARPI